MRARRLAVFVLIALTIIVYIRAVASANGATPVSTADLSPGASRGSAVRDRALVVRLESPYGILRAGDTVHPTLIINRGSTPHGVLHIEWDARLGDTHIDHGAVRVPARGESPARLTLMIRLPEVERPTGLDLSAQVNAGDGVITRTLFPFTVLPPEKESRFATLTGRSRVALYDPGNRAAGALRSIGLKVEQVSSFEDLALYDGDLIIVGPGGFTRGNEALGPVLAARARAGMRILLLEQPTLPGTLTEDLRLWPAFQTRPMDALLVASGHPILRGLDTRDTEAYFNRSALRTRPLMPPTRGNFRVLAETRIRGGRAWQQGVLLIESAIGEGSIVAAQTPLCADYPTDPQARILLLNIIEHLLERSMVRPRTHVYGDTGSSLPTCLDHLAIRAARAPMNLDDVDVLLVPGDWRAPRRRAGAALPSTPHVARFLHNGGTIVLLNPQSIVLDYLGSVIGAPVSFIPHETRHIHDRQATEPLLQGISHEDLDLIARPGRAELHLRDRPGNTPIRPILVAPGLAAYHVGRGVLVALTLPDGEECKPSRVSGLLARLLTNLGIPLDHRPGIDPAAVALLNQ